MLAEELDRVVDLRGGVPDVKRERGAVVPAAVVGAGQAQEAAGSLARTGGIDVLDVEPFSHDLRIAGEVVGILPPAQRAVAEGDGVAECEVAVTFTLGRGRHRAQQGECGSHQDGQDPGSHIAHPRMTAGS